MLCKRVKTSEGICAKELMVPGCIKKQYGSWTLSDEEALEQMIGYYRPPLPVRKYGEQ